MKDRTDRTADRTAQDRPSAPGSGKRPVRGSSAARRAQLGVASSRARFADRASRVRRRPWLLAGWAVAVIALLVAGVWLVELSPVLAARSVRVEGVPARTAAEIAARADVPIGMPLARVDTAAVADRVIASATLAEVKVSRSWPHTVVIEASPRVPVVAVKNSQGQVQVVDASGISYATVATVPKGVPLIRVTEDPPTKDSLLAGISVLKALNPAQRQGVTNVTVSSANLVTLNLSGRTVIWGGADDPQLKVEVLDALMKQAHVSRIDVSAPMTPVVK